jgi:glycosyltransferase involved in cell wall biosynthesis
MQEEQANNTGSTGPIRFSVIIPTINRSDMLRQAIEALCQQENPSCAYEIIAVDNGSTDDTPEMVEAIARESPVPIYYLLEPRRGSHYARNTGFKVARGKILGLIDDDVIVDPNWVKNIVGVYDNPEVSCAGGKITIRWVNGPPAAWVERFKGVLGEIDYGHKLMELTRPQTVYAGSFSIRKDVLLKVGGYNPCNAPGDKLVGDGESGLCQKVYDSGGRIFWVPDATAWHVQDAKRVTRAYIWRRGRYQGMSDAYTIYRRANGDSFGIWAEVRRRGINLVFYILDMLRHTKLWGKEFNKVLYECQYMWGLLSYLLRIKTDSKLRQMVTQNDWINEPPSYHQ